MASDDLLLLQCLACNKYNVSLFKYIIYIKHDLLSICKTCLASDKLENLN